MAKRSEKFTRMTDKRILEELERIVMEENLPPELVCFNTKSAAKVLQISVRKLRDLKARRVIAFNQERPRTRITFTAKGLIDYLESIKQEPI